MKKALLIYATLLFHFLAIAQWENQNAGFTNKVLGFYEFSIVNENTVWAICYDGYSGLFGSNPVLDFTRTIDGGETWIPGVMGTDTTLAFSNISAISETEAWVAMHRFGSSNGGGGGLFHTTDAGLNWTQSNANTIFNANSFPNFVYFKDAMNGISGGNVNDGYFEIYKTIDGGTNWTRTPQENFPTLPVNGGTGWFNGYAVVGNTIWFGSTRSKIYKSTDFGTTWTIANVSNIGADRVYEIAFNDDALNGVCHTRNTSGTTKLFATSDGGLTWTLRTTTSIPNWRRDRITSVPGTNIFVSTSTSAPLGSSYSTDNGLTWTVIENTTQKAACRFLNSTTGWAGGFFSDDPQIGNLPGIYKWDNTISLGTNSYENNEIKIFPVPSNDFIIISSDKNSNSNIEIIDMLGRTVLASYLENNEIKVDISTLEKGNYLVKIKNEATIVTKKITVN